MAVGKGKNRFALANLDIEASIERIASGTLSREIAAEFGVTPWAVRQRLMNHPNYKQAVAEQAHQFVEKAMAEIMSDSIAGDNLAIAHARAKVEAAFKYARVHNQAYADKPAVNVGISPEALVTIDAGSLLQFVRASQQLQQIEHNDPKDSQVIDM